MKAIKISESSLVEVTESKDWYSWINLMPPPPNDFHVVGEVLVGNPGVEAILTPKQPQGINPTMLLLDLILIQRAGFWAEVQTWVQARYEKVVAGNPYKLVTVYSDGKPIAEMPVDIIH